MRRAAVLDPVLTNKEWLTEGVKIKGSLNCSDQKVVKFRTLSGGSKAEKRLSELHESSFWRLQGLAWKNPVENSYGEESRELIDFSSITYFRLRNG